MARFQIVLTIQVEANHITYITEKYLPKEYPGLPDCVDVHISELEDHNDAENA